MTLIFFFQIIFTCCIWPNPYKKNAFLFIKKERKGVSYHGFRKILVLIFFVSFGIYNKFVKILKDLTNISTSLKNSIHEN